MPGLSIGIVGAGIGGLTAALVLARAGHAVTILERREDFSERGAGLQISPNASRILLDLGLGPALRGVVGEPDRVVVRSARSGREIGSVAQGAYMRERYGAPAWVIQRSDLQAILLDAVRGLGAVELLTGRNVEGVGSTPGAASLTLAGAGSRSIAFDAVIGADGLWSQVRGAVGAADPLAYRGYVAWRATVDRRDAPEGLAADATGLWLEPGGHVVHYPIAGGRLVNIVVIERRREPVEGWSAPGDRDLIRARFAGAAPALRELVAAPERWLLWSLYDRPVETLARGRIALLGDAGHPVLPFLAQGAALAIEDAAVLGATLAADDVPGSLEAYGDRRGPRVRRVQREARRNGRIYHASGAVALGRDLVIRGLGPRRMTRRYDWLYGFTPPGAALAPPGAALAPPGPPG